jgi:hypothetical protein
MIYKYVIYIVLFSVYIYVYTENEHGKYLFFAANRNRNWKFVSLGLQTINGKQHLLFQLTCPSKHIKPTTKLQ